MSKCKVLIVDDIAENIAQVVDMLSNLDIEIKKAYGGKEAIELVETYKPNIVLLDLMMPEVNGWDVIQHIRAKYDKNEMISSLPRCSTTRTILMSVTKWV